MDKNQDTRSILGYPKNITGYTIEIGDTTYGKTLEERIQAAKAASSYSKQILKQNIKGKSSLLNCRNLEKDTNSQNVTFKKTTLDAHELKKKNRHNLTNFESTSNVPFLNSTFNNNFNYHVQSNHTSCSLKPTFKGGGLMQHRLESIKANKKLSNKLPENLLECDYNALAPNLKWKPISKNLSHQDTVIKNIVPKKLENNISKNKDLNTKSTVQKKPFNEKIKHLNNTYTEHCNRISDISENSNTSVQYRLTRAKEEIYARSKNSSHNNVSKIKGVKNVPTESNIKLNNNVLKHNIKNKTKRLNQSNQMVTKKIPIIASTTKKLISNKSDISKIFNKQLITEHQKLVLNNIISSKPSETVVSTKLENHDILKKSKQKELNSFSFVIPETNSAQHRLEEKKLNLRCNNDDSMEWEDEIETSNDIVDKVNDLRKTVMAMYEPMECTPESIMHSDQINYCLVMDTNIFLSNLKSITLAVDKYLPEYKGYATIVLPWQVLQELDCIKTNENNIGYQAREAIRWLLDMISKNHPRLKGQPMTSKKDSNADDAILKCALIVKEKVNCVNLVTDDKILSIKSEVNGITVRNSAWLQDLVLAKTYGDAEIFQKVIKKYPIIDNELIMKFESRLEHIIVRVLKFAVDKNMHNFTTKTWWKVYALQQPFNLTKCLSKLKEHWNVIAPHQLFKVPQKQLEWVECFFKDFQELPSETSLNWNELYTLLKHSTEILNALPYEYYSLTDMLFYDLMKARKMLKRQLNSKIHEDEQLSMSLSNDLNMSSDNSSTNIDNILLDISKEVDTFCLNFYEANGFKHGLPVNKSLCKLQGMNLDVLRIEDYCHKLSNIIKVMFKIKQLEIEQIMESRILIDEFLKAIVAFDNNLVNLNREHLIDYCLMGNKNSFFNILISFQNNMSAIKNLISTVKFKYKSFY